MDILFLLGNFLTIFLFFITLIIYIIFLKNNHVFISFNKLKKILIPFIIFSSSMMFLSILQKHLFYSLNIYLFLLFIIGKDILFVNKTSFYSPGIKINFSQVKKIIISKDSNYFSIDIINYTGINNIKVNNLILPNNLKSFIKILTEYNINYEIN